MCILELWFISCHFIWPRLPSLADIFWSSSMPPKKKAAEKEEEHVEVERVGPDLDITSPLSMASSASSRSGGSLSVEQLQLILESNQRTMTSLLATLATPSSSASSVPKVAQVKVPKWTDDEIPYEYFVKLDKALTHNGIHNGSWGKLLPIYLSGRAQAALAQVDLESLTDYESIKTVLLDSLGDTPASADRKWWSISRLPGEEPGQFYLRVRSIGLRKMHGLKTREDFVEHIVLSRFLSLLSPDCYSFVTARQPKTGLEAAKLLQEFEETRSFQRRRQPWKEPYHGHHKREPNVNYNQGSSGSPKDSAGNSSTNSLSQNQSEGSNQVNVEKSFKQVKGGRQGRKPIVCHGCNQPGHIRPNCPDRVRVVKSPEPSNVMFVKGYLAGRKVGKLRIDTGADRSVVRADFIPSESYTDEVVNLDSWRGAQCSVHKVAVIPIKVGEVEVSAKVAVVDQLDCPALLGRDLGPRMIAKLMSIVMKRVEVETDISENSRVTMQAQAVRATRAQAAKDKAEAEAEDLSISECCPVSWEELVDQGEESVDEDPVPTPLCWEEPVDDSVVDIPLPNLADSDSLAEEQQADPTLKAQYVLAGKGEKGYSFLKNILVHTKLDELGDDCVRILVPKGRRLNVLKMAHSHMMAGHFGRKKTFSRLQAKFSWPRMWVEVKQFVTSCSLCQKFSTKDKARAPLQPLQVEGEPFSKVAFDLVGPLPKSRAGFRYILTMMDLFTKYPTAIPLKRVDNISVLDAMFEIFSCYGLPKVLLTDQGSVFTSKLTHTMCDQFGIEKIQTSPYHPQSDGALERWHACLKSMLKKQGDLKDWDKHLKYILFAYRSTPHCTTGFAPFTLLFGREVRGPLDLLQESWLEQDCEQASVFEWLTAVKAELAGMSQLVGERECVAKAKMKAQFDKGASVKKLEPGDMVLVWKPGIHSKMGDSWDGPYQISEKISEVTYKVQVPGKAHKSKILHSNLLRKWTTPASSVHRVAIVDEEEDVENCPMGLRLGRVGFSPSHQQQVELDKMLDKHKKVLNSVPGQTSLVTLNIDTEGHKPVTSHPYRIAPRWREEVKSQIDALLQLGIIEPSTSPWSSSVVTVKKKDGGVRICIDFRAVNAVTIPDPYQMPLIEEILDLLATAKFISKVDLNKGFHQIPIASADMCKTAFCTPWGKFQFRMMPFGLRNGPAVFQRLMDQLLHQDKDISVVYIDDIAIFSSTWEAHCKDISRILGRLSSAGLTANLKKCVWGQTHCEFLGHLVGNGQVRPADLKVKAIEQFSRPVTKRNVRQFLGLAGYYRKYVKDFASHSFNLSEATRKSAPDKVAWTPALDIEFLYLKNMLCAVPALTLPTVGDEFLLQTDASGVGLGAVLNVIRNQEELPVAFYSRKLLPRERCYAATELEGLAVVDSIIHFDAYLATHPFTLETDHRALLFLNSDKQANGRLARWALKLQPFSFSIKYKPGVQHVNADALSRMYPEDDDFTLPVSSTARRGGDVMRSPHMQEISNMG